MGIFEGGEPMNRNDNIELIYVEEINFLVFELGMLFVKTELVRGAPYFRMRNIKMEDLCYFAECLVKPNALESFFDFLNGKISQSLIGKKEISIIMLAIFHGVTENFLQEHAIKTAYNDYCKHEDSGNNPADFNMRERVNEIRESFSSAFRDKEKVLKQLVAVFNDVT